MRYNADLRREYESTPLRRSDLRFDPIDQFREWFEKALELAPTEANAMTVATATPDGVPSARIVLLKQYDADGFVFFTNFESRKGQELEGNPHAALVFYWPNFNRQVRIEGTVSRVRVGMADRYFGSRPRRSCLSALISRQSAAVKDREALEGMLAEAEGRFEDLPVPRPSQWGGYRVWPQKIEFWQGQLDRLHDRFLYTRDGEDWKIERLFP